MLVIDKPPLEAVYLAHSGVKGMRWGHRKKRPDEAERKARFGPRAKKIALGTAGVAGAIAIGVVLQRSGAVKMSSSALTDPASNLYANVVAGKRAATDTLRTANARVSDISNARQLLASPQLAPVRRQVTAVARQRAVAANRQQQRLVETGDMDAIRRGLEDPNFVWDV